MATVASVFMAIVLGLLVGALAKFLMPGRDPGGIIVTCILGIAGAFVGSWIANMLQIGGATGYDWQRLVTAVGGAMLLLLAYRAYRMLVPTTSGISNLGLRSGVEQPVHAFSARSDSQASDTIKELTDTVKGAFNANVLQKLSGSLGENPGAARKALEAMVPTILAGISSQASSSSGVSRLFEVAKDLAQSKGDLAGKLESQLTEGGLDDLARTGGGVLNSLFGDKLGGLIGWVTRYAGIKESSASSLMGMAASLVLSQLGKNILQKGLTASTFGSMLSSLAGPVSKLLPPGIADVPGMSRLADLGDRAAATTRSAVETGQRVGAGARGAYRETVGAAQEGASWLSAVLPLLLIAIPLLAFLYLMRGGADKLNKQAENVQVNVPRVEEPRVALPQVKEPEVKTTVIPAAETQPPLVETAHIEKFLDIKLPDGRTMKLPQTSFLNAVYKYLSDPTAPKGHAFVFENLDFDGATVKVTPATQAAIDGLRTLMSAYNHSILRIEGYTDDSGSPVRDRAISQERADALKSLMVKAGIPSDAIIAVGEGGIKPREPNDTEEHRARNRRIELAFQK